MESLRNQDSTVYNYNLLSCNLFLPFKKHGGGGVGSSIYTNLPLKTLIGKSTFKTHYFVVRKQNTKCDESKDKEML